LILAWALQQCSATALPVIITLSLIIYNFSINRIGMGGNGNVESHPRTSLVDSRWPIINLLIVTLKPQSNGPSISLIADLRPEGRIANEMRVK